MKNGGNSYSLSSWYVSEGSISFLLLWKVYCTCQIGWGTRPLGNTEFLRKLLVKITMLCAAADIRAVAKGMNSFLEKRGTENLVWTAKVAVELGLGNHHLLFSDIKNAFNTVDRVLALACIDEELPIIYDAFHTIYSAYSDM